MRKRNINYKVFVEKSAAFLENYIKENRLNSVVIGISGGIDSTVSAAIASIACKNANVPLIGRSLPGSTNKNEEVNTATLVGNAFCDDFKEVSIEGMYAYTLCDLIANEGELNNIQKGNIKARLRMIYFRNLASLKGGIVLDNDNLSEYNLGFWTVGGDSPMDLNLGLHYLWKTEVYELANYLAHGYATNAEFLEERNEDSSEYRNKFNALLDSINLTPTDGNGVSKSDCEQFGLDNYEQVDDVLQTMYYPETINVCGLNVTIEGNERYIRLIDSYNEQGVDKVMVLHQNTEYKRKDAPIKPKFEDLQ